MIIYDQILRDLENNLDNLSKSYPGLALLTRGKRIRSKLCLISSSFGERPLDNRNTTLCLGIETFHAATLLHDDIIDRSETRRGPPATWKEYGNGMAIFLGDFLSGKATEFIAGLNNQITKAFAAMTEKVQVGQILELAIRNRICLPTYEEWYKITESKTASFFDFSSWAGAKLNKCPTDVIATLSNFGHNFGMAFQFIDDVSDLSSNSEEGLSIPCSTGECCSEAGRFLNAAAKCLDMLPSASGKEELRKVIEELEIKCMTLS